MSTLERATAHAFYNSLGADMEPGQSLSEYIDELEVEMYDRYGIPMPDEDEIDEYTSEIRDVLDAEDEILKQGGTPQGFAVPVFGLDDDGNDEFDEELNGFEGLSPDEMPSYKPMESVLPPECRVDNVTELPFHKYTNGVQDTAFGDGTV